MIIGGQAVLVYGEPRITKDIDITLGTGTDKLKDVIDISERLKLKILVKNNVKNFVSRTMVLPLMEEDSGIRVDLIFSFTLYERQAIERANNIKMGKSVIKFASLEDIIIHKIISGRARDIEDIKSILLKNPKYDKKYITKWLKKFGNSLNENFLNLFRKIRKDIK
jgi:predicted nucleotidyltransferase